MIRIRRIFLLALLVAALVLGLKARSPRNGGMLKVYFLDVGQGDAIYVRTPSGRDMLVDGGPGASVLQKLAYAMPWDDRAIDVVVETHPDADHIGGLPEVMRRYSVSLFLEPGVPSNSAVNAELQSLVRDKDIPVVFARRGLRVDFGDGAAFNILFPDMDAPRATDTNTASIVGHVRYGKTSIMLTGDSPKAVESRLVEIDGQRLKSDVLKAGHHGSRTSSGEGYVKAVDPEYAVISAGKGNRYGHPHAETMELFERLGIAAPRTDEEGTIEFSSDGRSVRRE